MRWAKFTLFLAAGLTLLAALVLGWLLTADLGVFKPRIERLVTDATGRPFSIDGELHISVGEQTVVVANDVRLANAGWAAKPLMLDVGRIELRLDTWSFLNGPILVELLRISDSRVHLAKSVNNEENWNLQAGQAMQPKDARPEEPGMSWLVRKIEVDNALITYASPARPAPLALRVEQFSQQHDADNFLGLLGRATMADRDIVIDARLGPWDALLDQADIDFRLSAQVDTLRLTGEGHIDDLLEPRRPSLEFTARGPDLNDLARLLNLEEQFAGDINLSGSLSSIDDGPLVLDVEGNVGQMQARAVGAFSDLQSLEQAELDLAISGPDLNRMLRLAGAPPVRSAPYAIELSAERRGPELVVRQAHMEFAEAEFDLVASLPNFPTVDGADIQLTIAGQDFERFREITRMPGAATGPYSLTFNLSETPDGNELVKLEARSSLLSLSGGGSLGNAPDYVGSRLDFRIDTDSLASVGEAYRIEALPDRAVSVTAAIEITDAGFRTTRPLTLSSGDVTANIEGLLSSKPALTGSDLTFSIGAPDFASVAGDFVTSDVLPSLPVAAGGRLQIQSAGFRLRDTQVKLGSASLEIGGLIKPARGLAGSALRLTLQSPALEELTAPFENMAIHPGPITLSADVGISSNAIGLTNLDLSRQRAQVTGSADIMLPLAGRNATFDLRGRGDDLHAITGAPFGFQPAATGFTLTARGNTINRRLTLDKLDFALGSAAVTARGQLDLEQLTGQTRFALGISVPDLSQLGTFGGRRFNQQRFALDANLKSEGGILTVDNLVAKIGDSDIRGAVVLEGGDVPYLNVAIESDQLRYAPILERDEAGYVASPTFTDGRLIPDIPLPFEQMKRVNSTVDIAIADLQREALRVTRVKLIAELRDGALDVRQFGFRAAKGWLQARGSLEPRDGTGKASLALTANDLSIAIAGINEDLSASAGIEVNLQSTGNDLRSVAGNLDGVAFVRLSELTVAENRLIKRLYGDMLNEIVSTINPFAKTSTKRRLECVVAPLEFAGGIASTKPSILISSDKIRIVADATVNLKDEKIEMQFNSTPRKGITISAGELFNPYVKVIGTLAAPRLAVNQQGMLISGGAAVATGGLSILAKAAWERVSRDPDPCKTFEDLGIKALGGRFAGLEPPDPG
jgi:uncharacterized protein involved in outer membrane biogenesis